MTVLEIMERVGSSETGRTLAYIKDGLREINMISETHINTERIDIAKDQRFYEFPKDMIKVLDIRCKNQNNSEGDYHSIPRSIYKPNKGDSDGI